MLPLFFFFTVSTHSRTGAIPSHSAAAEFSDAIARERLDGGHHDSHPESAEKQLRSPAEHHGCFCEGTIHGLGGLPYIYIFIWIDMSSRSLIFIAYYFG